MSTQEFFLPTQPPSEVELDTFASALADVTTLILQSDLAKIVFSHFSKITELEINTIMAMYSYQDMITTPEWEDMPQEEFYQLLQEVEKSRDTFGTRLAIETAQRDRKIQEDEEFAVLYKSIENGFDNLVKTQGVRHTIPKGLHKKAEILRKVTAAL